LVIIPSEGDVVKKRNALLELKQSFSQDEQNSSLEVETTEKSSESEIVQQKQQKEKELIQSKINEKEEELLATQQNNMQLCLINHHEEEDEEYLSERVVLNVGGSKFEVTRKTLVKYPNTKLGKLFSKENIHLQKTDKNGEFFFDRNPRIFEVILDFYRTGDLCYNDIPHTKVQEELKFWEIRTADQLAVVEEEVIDLSILPVETLFKDGYDLIHTEQSKDIRKGIEMLEEILKREEHKENLTYLYYFAFGLSRTTSATAQAISILDFILEKDPEHQQSIDLKLMISDRKQMTARFGLMFLGFVFLTGTMLLLGRRKNN